MQTKEGIILNANVEAWKKFNSKVTGIVRLSDKDISLQTAALVTLANHMEEILSGEGIDVPKSGL